MTELAIPDSTRDHPSMLKVVLKWTLILASALAVGPLMARMLAEVRDIDGGRAITLLINGELTQALLCGLALFASILCVGVLGARFFSLTTAMLCGGLVLAWAATSLGSLEAIVRRAGDGRDLIKLGIEGLLVCLLAAAVTYVFLRVSALHQAKSASSPVKAPSGPSWQRIVITGEPNTSAPIAPLLLSALGAGVVVAGVVVWLLALSGARTQTIFATSVAGLAAGAVAQLMTAGRGFHLTPIVPILSLAVLALLGPIAAQVIEGNNLVAHVYDGTVFNLARPVSLDWAAGALIGVPVGMSWAGAAVDKLHH